MNIAIDLRAPHHCNINEAAVLYAGATTVLPTRHTFGVIQGPQ